jgi:hypothetical protein
LKQSKVEKKQSEVAKPMEIKKKDSPKAKATGKIAEKQARVTVGQESALETLETKQPTSATPNRAGLLKKTSIQLKKTTPDDREVGARTSKKKLTRAKSLDCSSAVASPLPPQIALKTSKPDDPAEARTAKKERASERPIVASSDAASAAAPPAKTHICKKKVASGETPRSSRDTEPAAAVTVPLPVKKTSPKKSKRNEIATRAHTSQRKLVKPLVSAGSAVSDRTAPTTSAQPASKPPVEHAGCSEDTEEVDSTSSPARISETWRLESDDKTQESAKGIQSSTLSPSEKTPTAAKKAAGKRKKDGVCAYPSCTRPATYKCRCAEHNARPRCSHPHCTKFAHAGGQCIAHGGGPRCAEGGCGRRVRTNGRCYAHGGGVLCSHPKCTTRAKTKGKCIAHGGGTVCSQPGCNKLVTSNGKCIAHGGGLNCTHQGCDKRAQLQGKCIEHSQADTTVPDKPTKRFRGATLKNGRMQLAAGVKRAGKRPSHISAEAAQDDKKPAKRPRRSATSVAPEPQATAMTLRSGHRMSRTSSEHGASQRALLSAEAALQMALELSKVEF